MITGSVSEIMNLYKEDLLSIYRLSCGYMVHGIDTITPVLHGDLRASWTANAGGPVTQNRLGGDRTNNVNATRIVNSLTLNDNFSYANSQPYVFKIESEGWSGKAPTGMVGPTVASWQKFVDKSVNNVNR